MAQQKVGSNPVKFRGGCITGQEVTLIKSGGYSMIQNMRHNHPGFEKRLGCRVLHTGSDTPNEVVSLFQFSKGRVVERHFYAQMGDADVLEATTNPPGGTGAAFGSEVFSGSSGQVPASWSVNNDIMVFSNGADQHQIYPGTDPFVDRFVVFVSAAAIPTIPDLGSDYTEQVTDGLTTTVAVLDLLSTLAAYDCIFIKTNIPATSIKWTVSAASGTASDSQIHYWNGAWTEVTGLNDATELLTLDVAPATNWSVGDTITGQTSTKTCVVVSRATTLTYNVSNRSGAFTLGEVLTNGTYTADQGAAHPQIATLGYSGSMSWTVPTDEIPHYMFNECGFWYRLSLASGALGAEVEVSAVQYNTVWKSIQNVWDGIPIQAVEVSVYDQTATTYSTYSGASVTANNATSSDIFYFNSPDPIVGFYIDIGETPNTTASTTINDVHFFNGANLTTSVSNIYDGTDGLSKSGWVTFSRQSTVQPCQFNDSKYYSYWYSFTVDKTLSATVDFSIDVMPYYTIGDFGSVGLCNCAWKDRMLYVFTRYPNDIVVSAKHQPMVLNGDDYTILDRPGDGRSNRVVCMKRIYNELLVWQEEKGVEGGCLTLYQGYSPDTFGKLVVSTKYGTFSAKTAVVVDGIRMNINNVENPPVSVAFFLSHFGVFMCDGKTIECISDAPDTSIQNYFDPTAAECITDGYESKMWLAYDPSNHCLRIGLVSGSSATLPNIFPVYDIEDRAWSFDVLIQEFACFANVEAGSGSVTAIQVAGGIDDGIVYQSNYGLNDINTAIDAYAKVEIDLDGKIFNISELVLRTKTQSAGNVTVTPTLNGVDGSALTLSMIAGLTNQVIKRHRVNMDLISDHISLKFQNSTVSQSVLLEDFGVKIKELENQ